MCGDEIIKNIKQEKVSGVTLDNKLNFATYLLNITKNANKKSNALARVQNYITNGQKKLIFSSFIESQFTYLPLIWIVPNAINNLIRVDILLDYYYYL